MKATAWVSLLTVASVTNVFAAETVIKGPSGVSIICSQFSRQPDGNWKSSQDATLSYPDKPGSFGNNSFGSHGISVGGVDIAVFLDEKCGKI